MDEEFWYGMVFGFGFFVLGTVIVVVIITQVGAFSRARIARREQAKDRELIAKYEELAASSGKAQDAAAADLADVRSRLGEIERMMREVA